MTHDPIHGAMFWVGALFVFLPLTLAGGALLVIWLNRRRERRDRG